MITHKIVCDMCGKKITDGLPAYPCEYASLIADWGYGSSHDGDRLQMQFCGPCVYDKIIPMCQIAPPADL